MSYERLGNIATITNGKRNAQDAVENGSYPLYDRSVIIKKSDKYLFDKEALIVAGEGKTFIPRYYKGKFDLHQRCYAIFDVREDYSIKYLYYYIKWNQRYFQSVFTGSTVPSLRLGNFTEMPIKNYSFEMQDKISNELSHLEKTIFFKNKIVTLLDELVKSRFICQEAVVLC